MCYTVVLVYPTDGSSPGGGLIQDTEGNLYGTTESGGIPFCGAGYGCGTVAKLSKTGTETVLYRKEAILYVVVLTLTVRVGQPQTGEARGKACPISQRQTESK